MPAVHAQPVDQAVQQGDFRKGLGHLDDGMQQVDCTDPLTAL